MILSILTLVAFSAAIQGYRSSMSKAEVLLDQELSSLAGSLISFRTDNGLTYTKQENNFACQIWTDGQLIYRTDNSPESALSNFIEGFSEVSFAGQRWRSYVKKLDTEHSWLIVAQPIQRRIDLAEGMTLTAVTPLILSIPILAILISLAVKRSLNPLSQLSQALKSKKTDDLSKINITQKSKELMPVINTMNSLFARLNEAFTREKRFASDAAHELRTPLSVLKVNIHNMSEELGDNKQSQESLAQLKQGVDRMAHVIEQILLLNRTSPEAFQSKFQKVDLHTLCHDVIRGLYPDISENDHQIEYVGKPLSIDGDEFSMKTLLQNLITNAIKYTEDGSVIRVSLTELGNNISLRIEDSGKGLNEKEFKRVFDRFYRVGGDQHNSNIIGCGLGLSIVKHIVILHDASIKLAKSKSLGGLSVTVLMRNSNA